MRRIFVLLVVTLVPTIVFAQPRGRRPIAPGSAYSAEIAVKEAIERLGEEKKAFERDLKVLGHIRNADKALVDTMQPTVAVEKAADEITEAERLNTDFVVRQGLIRVRQELENARRSPASADFGRLRNSIRGDGLGPSSRLVSRNALRLQEETLAWVKVQELISTHLRSLADITGDSLRATVDED